MKKFLTLLLTFSLLSTSIFFGFTSVNAQGQEEDLGIKVFTTGYSILSPNEYVFGGYYSGNTEEKPFTTLFEFQRSGGSVAGDFSLPHEETIPIERGSGEGEHGDFFSSPELQLFSQYYFRAVGFYNDTPDEKYYGNTMVLVTGYYPNGRIFPIGGAPITVTKDYVTVDFVNDTLTRDILASCRENPDSESCKTAFTRSPICYDTQVLRLGVCVEKQDPREQEYEACMQEVQDPVLCERTYYKTCGDRQKLVGTQCVNITEEKDFPVFDPGSSEFNPLFDTSNFNNTVGSRSTVDSGDFVKCGTETDGDGNITNPCNFNYFIELINDIINFLLYKISIPIAAIMFAYAGFELLTSGGEASKRNKAKKIFLNVVIGLLLIACAYLIVNTILSVLGADSSWQWFGLLD